MLKKYKFILIAGILVVIFFTYLLFNPINNDGMYRLNKNKVDDYKIVAPIARNAIENSKLAENYVKGCLVYSSETGISNLSFYTVDSGENSYATNGNYDNDKNLDGNDDSNIPLNTTMKTKISLSNIRSIDTGYGYQDLVKVCVGNFGILRFFYEGENSSIVQMNQFGEPVFVYEN
jgi:hypothetical protein